MNGICQERGFVAFDQMTQPRQGKGRRNEEQGDQPMPPNHDDGRESDRDGDHVEGPIDRLVMRAVVVRIQSHLHPHGGKRGGAELYARFGISSIYKLKCFVWFLITLRVNNSGIWRGGFRARFSFSSVWGV